ncbi:MAG: DUF2975 domain-containing protein [Mediterraneibacter sp.]|nr:DUF2975 domain-containing protein [Candidatus Mediterraneibacter caccogallinarum]
MRQSRLISFTKYFLDFMFFSGILVEVSLPFSLKMLGEYYWKEMAEQYWPMLIIFGLSGICGLIIVYQLRKMMKTVVKRECFVDNNTKSLSTMGKVSFVITVLFIVKCILLPTPASFVIVLTFFIAGVFSHVLSLVFEEAVRFKEENDLTI